MFSKNYLINEAMENAFDPKPVVTEYKKMLNLCKLNKFKSDQNCATFYTGFFNCSVQEQFTFEQWVSIYNTLLTDPTFVNNLCLFVAMWQPTDTQGMFIPVVQEIDSELETMKKNRVRFLSDAKAFFQNLTYHFDSISNTVLPQVQDQKVVTFLTTVKSVTTNFTMYYNKKIREELDKASNPNDIAITVRGETMAEDVQEFLVFLENGEAWMEDYMNNLPDEAMNETIINKAAETAKVLAMKKKKAEAAFEEAVMKKIRQLRLNRRNRRQAEVVGETLPIFKQIKRILRTAGLAIISPAVAATVLLIDLVIDSKTKVNDRRILIRQLEDEMEIVDEKISQAERNGDDKGKVELMRSRQKLKNEYERVAKHKFERQ